MSSKQSSDSFTDADSYEQSVTFLPEPARRPRPHLIVSVDDHLVEPPTTFDGRLPRKFGDRAPHVVDLPEGAQAWSYDGHVLPNVGFNAVVGRPLTEHGWDPVRFSDMRRAAWDPIERLRDMDLNGVYASMSFPSFVVGFGGGRLQTITKDRDLALAAVRAFNDWQAEEWVGAGGGRLIGCGVTWLHDPEVGAAEIRRNADRGFRALTFPEAPHRFGLPSIYSDYWLPILRACIETDTVICLHVGSGGQLPQPDAAEAPPNVGGVMVGMSAMNTALDWLFSGHPARLPELKISLTEGGIGWLPGVLDRLDHSANVKGDLFNTWGDWGMTPSELLLRNFYFCFLWDPKSLELRHQLNIDHIMFEVDYPHSDSSWPDSQVWLSRQIDGFPLEDQRKLSWQNAARLFSLDIPEAVQRDPESF
jgi:predicted TIM-barrel fold metal-dependent hydrolase